MQTIENVDLTHGVYALAAIADVHSPDTPESPGARLLESCQDRANEYDTDALLDAVREYVRDGDVAETFTVNDLPNDVQDTVHELADDAVQIYTFQCWQEFADLCLWQEDLSDLGEISGDDLTRDVAMRAQYMVASRLLPVLLAERAVLLYEANPQDEDPDDDEPMDMSGGSGGSDDR